MTDQRLPYLLSQYLNKSCSAAELQEFYSLVGQPANDRELMDLLDAAYATTSAEHLLEATRQATMVSSILKVTAHQPLLSESELPKPKSDKLWSRIALVAATIAVIVFGIWFYISGPVVNRNSETASQNDVDPGKSGATLTLANGQQIRLANAGNGEIAKQAGFSVVKTGDGQLVYEMKSTASAGTNSKTLNTLTTARGETYVLTLPDKSKVWMNAATTLKFPVSFQDDKQRRVELNGEAYFEVSKDKMHPFIVTTSRQEVEVLGTHFNISSYPEEQVVKTTLLEGSVKVYATVANNNLPGKSVLLVPGQQSVLTGSAVHVQHVDTDEAIAWKKGEFMFNDEPLEMIMNKIGRWYNLDVVYEDEEMKIKQFKGGITRFSKVSKVLTMLERTGRVNFEIKGNTIIVRK